MARLNRRKLRGARNDVETIPFVKLDLESPSSNETTKNQINNSQQKCLDSTKQPKVVLERVDVKSPAKVVSTRSRTGRNDTKTIRQETVAKDLISIAGGQIGVNTRLRTTKESSNDLNNEETKRKPVPKPNMKKSAVTKLDTKQTKQCNSNEETEHITDLKENETLPPTKLLRKRKMLDYKERSSIGTPTPSENGNVPVYRKYQEKPEKIRKRDPFTFCPDSDEEDKNSDISFRINIPKKRKIEPTKTVKRKKKINVNVSKYSDKINSTLNAIRSKFNKKNNIGSCNINKSNDNKESHGNFNKALIFNSTQVNNANLSTLGESHNDISLVQMMNTEKTTVNNQTPAFVSSGKETDVGLVSEKSLSRISFRMNTPKTPSRSVNILQNFVLDTCTSDSNSPTNEQIISTGGSWRFGTDIITRNPHLIVLKSNALPILNQEAIVDHTFDDKIGEVNRTIQIPETRSSPKQQSILNYIPTINEYSKENNKRQSLYDIDELSPLKFNNKENLNKEKQTPILKAKRNVLGQLDCNTLSNRNQTSTPHTKVPFNAPQFDVSIGKPEPTNQTASFSFLSDDIEQDVVTKNAEAKPFRMEVSRKQYKSKKGPDMITKPIRDSEVERIIEKDVGFDNLVGNHDLEIEEVGLFEDIEVPGNTTKSYKQPKKHMLHEKKEKPYKFTKEALKWVKEFNQMCDEVEQEELEIA